LASRALPRRYSSLHRPPPAAGGFGAIGATSAGCVTSRTAARDSCMATTMERRHLRQGWVTSRTAARDSCMATTMERRRLGGAARPSWPRARDTRVIEVGLFSAPSTAERWSLRAAETAARGWERAPGGLPRGRPPGESLLHRIPAPRTEKSRESPLTLAIDDSSHPTHVARAIRVPIRRGGVLVDVFGALTWRPCGSWESAVLA
jgi:hypothetical protein